MRRRLDGFEDEVAAFRINSDAAEDMEQLLPVPLPSLRDQQHPPACFQAVEALLDEAPGHGEVGVVRRGCTGSGRSRSRQDG